MPTLLKFGEKAHNFRFDSKFHESGFFSVHYILVLLKISGLMDTLCILVFVHCPL